jgi:hypothetical protein
MRYLLRLPRSKLRILVWLITRYCPLNKHLHNMGLIDEPNLHRLWDERRVGISSSLWLPKSDISKNAHIFETDSGRWRIWGSACICTAVICAGSDWITVTPWFIHSYEHFFFLHCVILSFCRFVSSVIFQFFICVVHIRPDLCAAICVFTNLSDFTVR